MVFVMVKLVYKSLLASQMYGKLTSVRLIHMNLFKFISHLYLIKNVYIFYFLLCLFNLIFPFPSFPFWHAFMGYTNCGGGFGIWCWKLVFDSRCFYLRNNLY